ncbi:alpha/beta hydrolase [Ramlibacter sp. G-1-2-2]|uniref:Alpha/beta hydrolase n=1 Tax=Ramlibacter agri TaxID=2728837 RepID=A0A848H1P1_9BURK|nr:alpha/beta hydrolase [Ramlibacter agri]NML42653.1 alpha/beta hydrolase [Ramlibacter agri]
MSETKAPLDAEIAEIDRRWKASGIPDLYVGSGPEMRARGIEVRNRFYPKPKLKHGEIRDIRIGNIRGRVVRPVQGEPTATLAYFHGGGFILGDLDSHEAHCIRIANATGAVVVSVDYSLAPEAPFPAGADDSIAASRWIYENRAQFGGADQPFALGGDSAGGNMAAVSAIACRDAGVPVAVQFLLYPATDMTGPAHGPVGTHYLGEGPERERKARDWRASPVLGDLKGVAPAIIGVGPYDFLYRDNLAFAQALRAAGVPVNLREFPTLNHGFFSYTAVSKASLEAAESLCADLAAALKR